MAPAARRLGRSLACAILLALAGAARGALMSVDYGSEYIKVALVAPGKIPIRVIGNEMSKRKSPAAVSFAQGERRLGEEASALGLRFPDRVLYGARDWLGKGAEASAAIAGARYLPYDLRPAPGGRGGTAVVAEGATYTSEEVVAMTLQYAQKIAEAEAGAQVRDAVVTVPAFFGQPERQALLDAAAVAGLNVLALVSEHAAAGLQWGIDKDFSNTTQRVVLYDMGSGSTTAALLEFSSYQAKEAGKKKSVGQFEVKGLKWDAALGGADFDAVLVEHFIGEVRERHGVDVRGAPKSVAKLKKEVRRTKEILSANKEAPISVEGLTDEVDFRSTVTREKFEELAAPLLERAGAPLRALLEETGVPVEELDAVELIGGGTRVPGVIAAVSAALGGRETDRHMDADEAIAFGAGLHAANISTTFRVRKFGAVDGAPYPLELQVGEGKEAGADDGEEEGEEAPAAAPGRKTLLPLWKKVPARRVVHVPDVTEDFTVSAFYGDEAPLPRGAPSPLVSTYKIGGVEAAREKHNTTGKVSVQFAVDRDGLLSCDKAEMQVEVVDYVEVKPPPKANASEGANATAAENATDAAEEAEAESEAGEADNATAPEKEYKMRRRMAKAALTVELVDRAFGAMNASEVRASSKVLTEWEKKDRELREAAEAKSTLEAYIYNTRDKLYEEEEWQEVTTEEQREAFQAELSEQGEWLDFEGSDAPTKEFRSRLDALRATGDKVVFRAKELRARPKAVKQGRDFVEATRKVVGLWESTKPWINETERAGLLEKVAGFEGWLDEKTSAQEETPLSEEPVFTASDVLSEMEPVNAALNRLKRKPAPKPPKAPKANATNATGAAGNATGGEANGTEPEEVEVPPPTIDMDDIPPEGGAGAGAAEDSEGAEEEKHEELR